MDAVTAAVEQGDDPREAQERVAASGNKHRRQACQGWCKDDTHNPFPKAARLLISTFSNRLASHINKNEPCTEEAAALILYTPKRAPRGFGGGNYKTQEEKDITKAARRQRKRTAAAEERVARRVKGGDA